MSEYKPDVWVVVKISRGDDTVYKVLGGWYGGFAGSDYWRLNSGITKATRQGDLIVFEGASGSSYICHKDTYRFSSVTAGIYRRYAAEGKQVTPEVTIELVDENTDWENFKWE